MRRISILLLLVSQSVPVRADLPLGFSAAKDFCQGENAPATELATKPSPSPRYGHQALLEPKDRQLYVLFGWRKNDIWSFNLQTRSWQKVCELTIPSNRRLLTTLDEQRARLYVLERSSSSTDLMWAFNLTTREAGKLVITNAGPANFGPTFFDPISNKATVLVPKPFHGTNRELDEAWTLDLSVGRWTQMISTKPVSPRALYDASLTYVQSSSSIYIVGGTNEDSSDWKTHALHDTWKLDLNNGQWETIKSSEPPPARFQHGAIFAPSYNRVYVVGGLAGSFFNEGELREDKTEAQHDSWYLQLPENTWKPAGRISTSQSSVFEWQDRPRIIITPKEASLYYFRAMAFGEVQRLDINRNQWQSLSIPNAPPYRDQYTMSFDPLTDDIYLFGGDDPRNGSTVAFNDVWRFSAKTERWEQLY